MNNGVIQKKYPQNLIGMGFLGVKFALMLYMKYIQHTNTSVMHNATGQIRCFEHWHFCLPRISRATPKQAKEPREPKLKE